jgi:hypothetical protein
MRAVGQGVPVARSGQSRHISEPFRKSCCITIVTTRADLRATCHRVPRCVSPLNAAVVSHACRSDQPASAWVYIFPTFSTRNGISAARTIEGPSWRQLDEPRPTDHPTMGSPLTNAEQQGIHSISPQPVCGAPPRLQASHMREIDQSANGHAI